MAGERPIPTTRSAADDALVYRPFIVLGSASAPASADGGKCNDEIENRSVDAHRSIRYWNRGNSCLGYEKEGRGSGHVAEGSENLARESARDRAEEGSWNGEE